MCNLLTSASTEEKVVEADHGNYIEVPATLAAPAYNEESIRSPASCPDQIRSSQITFSINKKPIISTQKEDQRSALSRRDRFPSFYGDRYHGTPFYILRKEWKCRLLGTKEAYDKVDKNNLHEANNFYQAKR